MSRYLISILTCTFMSAPKHEAESTTATTSHMYLSTCHMYMYMSTCACTCTTCTCACACTCYMHMYMWRRPESGDSLLCSGNGATPTARTCYNLHGALNPDRAAPAARTAARAHASCTWLHGIALTGLTSAHRTSRDRRRALADGGRRVAPACHAAFGPHVANA